MKEETMSDSVKINTVIDSLKRCALGDIKKASTGGSKMGAFILCSCLIDAMAGFIKGADTERSDYKNFVRDYLSSYVPENLYNDLRCKLVHSYSEGGSYLFVDAKSHLHLQINNGKTIINLENFIIDIENALSGFSRKLQDSNETTLRQNAIQRLDNNGIIQVFTLSLSGATSSLTPPVSGAP